MTERVLEKGIISGFNHAADFYHEHATVQKEVANRLIASLKPWQNILPPGPIIELGCGTGFVSKQLQKMFQKRKLIFTDTAPKMLQKCKDVVTLSDNISFEVLDAETVPVGDATYAMTISSFAAQWFHNPAYILEQWLDATKPGGLLLAAFPGSESFPEWKKHTEALGLPFTGNDLPNTEEMVVKLSSDHTQVDYYEDTITQTFDEAADFFGHLKNIGAGQQHNGRHLSPKEMRLLINHWNEQESGSITVSYHVVFLAVKKNFTG